MQFKKETILLNRTDRGEQRKGLFPVLKVFAVDTLCLIFVFLMERSMGSLPGEGIKTCWKAYC